jgi:hypothetical protein
MVYRGFRIGVRPVRDGYGERHIEVKIDGHFLWAYPYMRSTVDRVRADALKECSRVRRRFLAHPRCLHVDAQPHTATDRTPAQPASHGAVSTMRTVHLVHRHSNFGTVVFGFEHEDDATAYAALFPNAQVSSIAALDRESAAQLIAERPDDESQFDR